MELDCVEWGQLHLAQHGEMEPETVKAFSRLLRFGDTYIDVGAHVGFLTLVAREMVGESGRVLAIEPQPYNCERLLRNWEINGYNNLDLIVAAAGDEQGVLKIPQQSETDKSRLSLASMMPNALPIGFEVPLVRLDEVVSRYQLKHIRLLKIDVEGFEIQTLCGASNMLSIVDCVVFEALTASEEARHDSIRVCRWLEENNFEICFIDDRPWNTQLPERDGNMIAYKRNVRN